MPSGLRRFLGVIVLLGAILYFFVKSRSGGLNAQPGIFVGLLGILGFLVMIWPGKKE